MNEVAKKEIPNLRKKSSFAYLASIDNNDFPVMRTMLVLETESCRTQYFSTNTSSRKVKHFKNYPQASVYYSDNERFMSVLFKGTIEVCNDLESRKLLWREGFERYYPKGIEDPDYSVLKFTTNSGFFYNNIHSTDFTIDEIE